MINSNSCFLNKYFLFIIFLCLISTNTSAQNWRSGWVYIQNVETGMVIDIQGNVKANGTNAWPYSLNHSKAQMFRFNEHFTPERFGEDARYIKAYNKGGLGPGSNFYLSVKIPPMVLANPDTNRPSRPGTIRPDLILPTRVVAVDPSRPSNNKKTLRNYVFSIEEKREIDESPISVVNDLSISLSRTPKQIWKILPVPNDPSVYYIQNAHFSEKMVVEPLDFSSGGTLVLSSFTGSDIQKWRILKTAPPKPTNLKLSNFKWEEKLDQSSWWPWNWHHVQKIKGKLSWSNSNTSSLTKQNILIDSSSTNYEKTTLEPNKTSYKFNIKSSKSAKTEEHCFSVGVKNKWQADNWTASDDICEKPGSQGSSSPPTEPSPGVSKLIISNCHNGRKLVRLWTYDFTVNNGTWKDHGTLVSQWQGSGCPFGSPKEINFSDNHVYNLVALDCGNLPPNQTQGTCHKLTSSQIQGGTNGISLNFQIN